MFKRILCGILMAFLMTPLLVKGQEEASNQNRQNYLQLFDIYEDYPQLTQAEMEEAIRLLKESARAGMSEAQVIELLGQPSFRKESDRNIFLQYYAISEQVSTILTLQFYLSVEELMSEETTQNSEEISLPKPGLVLMDVQKYSQDLFQPIVDNYRDFILLSQGQDPDFQQLQEILGPPNNYRYDYIKNSYLYEWIYVTEEDELDYVAIEVNSDQEILRINIPETIYEREEVAVRKLKKDTPQTNLPYL